MALGIALAGWAGSLDACRSAAVDEGKRRSGVVVEEIRRSTLKTAGLRKGDVLERWELPVTHGRGTIVEELGSVFDWIVVKYEHAWRRGVQLRSGRGEPIELPPGRWRDQIRVRPNLTGDQIEAYRRGIELFEEEPRKGLAILEQLAARSRDDPLTYCWLMLRIGSYWSSAPVRDFRRRREAHRIALETAQRHGLENAELILLEYLAWVQHWLEEPEAEATFKESLERRWDRLGEESLSAVRALQDLGNYYRDVGRLPDAERELQEALRYARQIAPGSLAEAEVLIDLGVLTRHRGSPDLAERYYRDALGLVRSWTPGGLAEADLHKNLAILSLNRGRIAIAEDHYREEQKIRMAVEAADPDGVNFSAKADTLEGLGKIAAYRGQWDLAEELFDESFEHRKGSWATVRTVVSVLHLGELDLHRGDLDAAETWFRKALTLAHRIRIRRRDKLALCHFLLGEVALQRDDFWRARGHFEASLRILESVSYRGGADRAATLNKLGDVARRLGELETAEGHYTDALSFLIHELAIEDVGGLTAESFHRRGLVRRQLGDSAAAVEDFHDAIETLDAGVDRLLGGERLHREGFRARFRDLYFDTAAILVELGRPEDAFHVTERFRARGFLELLRARDRDSSPERTAQRKQRWTESTTAC